MATGVVANRTLLVGGQGSEALEDVLDVAVGPLGAVERRVRLVDVGLVMLVVVNLHRRLVDVGLEGVVCVRKIGNFECHLELLVVDWNRYRSLTILSFRALTRCAPCLHPDHLHPAAAAGPAPGVPRDPPRTPPEPRGRRTMAARAVLRPNKIFRRVAKRPGKRAASGSELSSGATDPPACRKEKRPLAGRFSSRRGWNQGPIQIGAPGFEPGASPTRTVRATRLRHAPREEQPSEPRAAWNSSAACRRVRGYRTSSMAARI